MTKNRLEAFSDGVIAILITIMVLELRVPSTDTWAALLSMLPIFLSYILSFIFIGIYWSNHHHMLMAVGHVNGSILWANMHLLFWLSLVPFTTAWMGEHNFTSVPTAVYAIDLLMCAIAYTVLSKTIISAHGPDSLLARAIGSDRKGYASLVLYVTAILMAFIEPRVSHAIFVIVAITWLIPDRRIERLLTEEHTRVHGSHARHQAPEAASSEMLP